MICIKTEIPKEICEIDDELKQLSLKTQFVYGSSNLEDRNNFINGSWHEEEREKHYSVIMGKYNFVMDALL